MSQETHEQIIEHRSVFTVDDALVVTTISETDTPVCGTCWRYVQHDDEQQTTEYVRVAWPCEVALIRERVAELEEQAEQSDWRVLKLTDVLADAVLLIHETRHDGAPAECAERICEIGKQLVQAARDSVVDNLAAALAQADETGRGAR